MICMERRFTSMNLHQLDKVKEIELDEDRYHLVFYGKEAFIEIDREIRNLATHTGSTYPTQRNLIIPAFEYQGIL